MIDSTHVHNMVQLLNALETQCGQRTILRYMEGPQVYELSADAFFQKVRSFAATLEARNLRRSHIGIMGANRVEWMMGFCAIVLVDAVAVLLSPDLSSQELSERAAQVDLNAIIFDNTLNETVAGAVFAPDFVRINLDHIPSSDCLCPVSQPDPESLSCILFTSGTTDTAKAVMLSHRAMVAGVCHNVIGHAFSAQLAILPFHHVAGLASVLNTWYLDAVACLGQDIKYLFRYLEQMKPDYTLTVPSILQVILRKLKRGGPNGRELGWDLHLIGCGGAKFQPEVIQYLNDHKIHVLQSYGATEAGGLGFMWEMTSNCRNSIGKPPQEIEIKIADGELFLRSCSVMMGYYKDPAATAEVLKDGWYATGDLCQQDENGYLYLYGRKKNLIILSNGENVSPEQIETALAACDAITEVMVGVENDRISATIFPNVDTSYVRAQIEAHIENYNRSVPYYRQVHNIHFTDKPFSKTEIGKMIRRSITGGNTL